METEKEKSRIQKWLTVADAKEKVSEAKSNLRRAEEDYLKAIDTLLTAKKAIYMNVARNKFLRKMTPLSRIPVPMSRKEANILFSKVMNRRLWKSFQ